MATTQIVTEQEPRLAFGPRLVPPPTIICCLRPGCRFTASALSEGRALRGLAAHLVKAHLAKVAQ